MDSSSQIEQTKESKTKVKTITVDIKGEVAKPGVYELPMDSRMQKLVQVAGGFTKGALQKEINLAQKLEDQQMVYVPNQKNQRLSGLVMILASINRQLPIQKWSILIPQI